MADPGPIDALFELIRQGGFVAPPLVLGLFVLWYGLGWRAMTLRRGDPRPLEVLVREARAGRLRPRGIVATATVLAVQAQRHARDARGAVVAEVADVRAVLTRHKALVRTVVVLAPLAGLLGTVGGMIETFDSLAEMALFSQSGGIAGGIAEALISTQIGLSVAIPGVILGKLLERAESSLTDELDELVELLSLPPEGA